MTKLERLLLGKAYILDAYPSDCPDFRRPIIAIRNHTMLLCIYIYISIVDYKGAVMKKLFLPMFLLFFSSLYAAI